MSPEDQNTLITYGSLMPGKSNFHIVEDIIGDWSYGSIMGHLINPEWELLGGYPTLSLGRNVEWSRIDVAVLNAIDLNPWWERLDYFEGETYQRVLLPYITADGEERKGWVYIIRI